MALDVRIYNGATAYYLVNSSGSPTAGGAATAAGTTPYSVQASDWTQSATQRLVTYAGGPPFGVGRRPVYVGFDNVQETIQIGISGSSSDNAISLIRQLRQILNTALYSVPAVLYWQPNGATSPTYFEIYSADVQEVGDWQNPAAGFTQVLCQVTWVRSAFGGRLATGETVINAVSFRSSFSGSPLCYNAFSTGAGDLIYDGQPINVTTASTSAAYIGSIDSVVTTATTQTVTTSSTTGAYSAASVSPSLGSTLQTDQGLKARLFASVNGSATNNPGFRAVVSASSNYSAGNGVVYTSPWIGSNWAYADTIWDCGTIPMQWLINSAFTSCAIWLQVRSPSGSVTLTLNNWYIIFYYTMCRIEFGNASGTTVRSFVETSNRPCLPLQRPLAWASNAGTLSTGPVIGTAPRYYSGASLFVHPRISWGTTANLSNTSTTTYSVTATQAPLYHTLRGNG